MLLFWENAFFCFFFWGDVKNLGKSRSISCPENTNKGKKARGSSFASAANSKKKQRSGKSELLSCYWHLTAPCFIHIREGGKKNNLFKNGCVTFCSPHLGRTSHKSPAAARNFAYATPEDKEIKQNERREKNPTQIAVRKSFSLLLSSNSKGIKNKQTQN